MPLHQPCLMVSQLELAYHLYIHCDNKFCTTIALFCAVWGMTFAVFLLGLPMLGGATAFDTASSIATAGLCLAYALPIGFRIVFAHHSFEPGPFSLGRYCHRCLFMHSGPCALSVQRRYLAPLYRIPFCGLLDAGFAAVMHLLNSLPSCLQAHSVTCRPALNVS